jgi:hypothetical protein
MTGGSKKGVYRLAFDDGSSVVGYLWNEEENYWPAVSRPPGYDPRTDPFSDASGVGLFEAAHSLLTGLGVRVPELYYLNSDVALVEHVPGGTLEELLDAGASGTDAVLAELAEALELMYGCRAEGFGKVGFADQARGTSCEQVVFDREGLMFFDIEMADSDFPEREFMIEIAEYNADRALGYV